MNLIEQHGAISVCGKKLCHEDGTPFFWLGDTHWFAMTSRCSLEDLKHIVAIRSKQGFTGFQTVVGIPPEVGRWSKNAANSGGLPFLKNGQVNKNYFIEVDQKLQIILDAGLVPMIFGGWGYQIDWFGVNGMITWWKELVSRYSHLPILFCLTGEVDLFPGISYGEGGSHFIKRKARSLLYKFYNKFHKISAKKISQRLEKWNQVGEWIAKNDPNKRPLSVHPHSKKSARELFANASWLTINSIQSGHSLDGFEYMENKTAQEVEYSIPFINLEPMYEGILGNFETSNQLKTLKIIQKNKAAGMTYGAQGLWNMNKKTDPFLEHWGDLDWLTALSLPGAKIISGKG